MVSGLTDITEQPGGISKTGASDPVESDRIFLKSMNALILPLSMPAS